MPFNENDDDYSVDKDGEVHLLDEDMFDDDDLYYGEFDMRDERNDSFTSGHVRLNDFYFPKEKKKKSRRLNKKAS